MQHLTKEIWIEIPKRRGIVSLHADVEQLVEESGIEEGIVLINAMHITASVFINDNESGLHADYERWLRRWRPLMQDLTPKRAGTSTTARAKTMRMRTTNGKLWGARLW